MSMRLLTAAFALLMVTTVAACSTAGGRGSGTTTTTVAPPAPFMVGSPPPHGLSDTEPTTFWLFGYNFVPNAYYHIRQCVTLDGSMACRSALVIDQAQVNGPGPQIGYFNVQVTVQYDWGLPGGKCDIANDCSLVAVPFDGGSSTALPIDFGH
jgi:hypothetical protein